MMVNVAIPLGDGTTQAVSPTAIPFHMNSDQREYWILFGIAVAGKGATQTEKKLNNFLTDAYEKRCAVSWIKRVDFTPFQCIRWLARERQLMYLLKKHKLGQYKRIEPALIFAASNLDVAELTIDNLEAVPGIGPKTARMILLYAYPDMQCVPLDTHILKYLRLMGILSAPKSTPPAGAFYNLLENLFVAEAKAQDKTVRQLDTEVWKAYHSGDLTKLPQPVKVLG